MIESTSIAILLVASCLLLYGAYSLNKAVKEYNALCTKGVENE